MPIFPFRSGHISAARPSSSTPCLGSVHIQLHLSIRAKPALLVMLWLGMLNHTFVRNHSSAICLWMFLAKARSGFMLGSKMSAEDRDAVIWIKCLRGHCHKCSWRLSATFFSTVVVLWSVFVRFRQQGSFLTLNSPCIIHAEESLYLRFHTSATTCWSIGNLHELIRFYRITIKDVGAKNN